MVGNQRTRCAVFHKPEQAKTVKIIADRQAVEGTCQRVLHDVPASMTQFVIELAAGRFLKLLRWRLLVAACQGYKCNNLLGKGFLLVPVLVPMLRGIAWNLSIGGSLNARPGQATAALLDSDEELKACHLPLEELPTEPHCACFGRILNPMHHQTLTTRSNVVRFCRWSFGFCSVQVVVRTCVCKAAESEHGTFEMQAR